MKPMENNLTPNQQALSLLRHMTIDFSIDIWQSKQCSIVCVEKILTLPLSDELIAYWQEVMIELERI